MTKFFAIGGDWGDPIDGTDKDSIGFNLEAWACSVARLSSEAHESRSNDYWGFHDYVGSLYIRDRLQKRLAPFANRDLFGVVFVADEVFRKFSEPDRLNLLPRLDPELPRGPWWWTRIPRRGPVRQELEEWVRRLPPSEEDSLSS